MPKATSAGLRTPEVARRLGIPGREVYQLIFAGELDGRPDEEGIVHVTAASVEAYLAGRASSPTGGERRQD